MTLNDIDERFSYSPSIGGTKSLRIEDVLREYKDLAYSLHADCGDNREFTIAMERLEESAMWSVKSILKDEYDDDY